MLFLKVYYIPPWNELMLFAYIWIVTKQSSDLPSGTWDLRFVGSLVYDFTSIWVYIIYVWTNNMWFFNIPWYYLYWIYVTLLRFGIQQHNVGNYFSFVTWDLKFVGFHILIVFLCSMCTFLWFYHYVFPIVTSRHKLITSTCHKSRGN